MKINSGYYQAKIVSFIEKKEILKYGVKIVSIEKSDIWGTRYIIRSENLENIGKLIQDINENFEEEDIDFSLDEESAALEYILPYSDENIKFFDGWSKVFTF